MAKLIKIKRKDGTLSKMWYSDLRVGDKRIRRAMSTDFRLAEGKLADLVKWRQAQRGQIASGDISWKLFKQRLFDEHCIGKAYGTRVIDKLALEYLENAIPIVKLAQVSPDLLVRARNRWVANGMNANYINRLVIAVKAAMHQAEKWNLIAKQNWETVGDIKTTVARIHFWGLSELAEIINELKKPYSTVAYLGGLGGFRLGEICNMIWPDVDFNMHRININPKKAAPGVRAWHPKDYEMRTVPIPPQLERHLQSLPRAHSYVLGRDIPSVGGMSEMMSRLLKNAGRHGTAHTLRHTYASHLVMAGVPIYTVSKLLGHASVETTERHYAHLAPSHLDEAAAKFPLLSLE